METTHETHVISRKTLMMKCKDSKRYFCLKFHVYLLYIVWVINNFWVYYTIPFGFSLFWNFWAIIFNFLNYFVWLRITDEGSVPEMRILSILLIKSDLKWCIHLSRSLYLYSNIQFLFFFSFLIIVIFLSLSVLFIHYFHLYTLAHKVTFQ